MGVIPQSEQLISVRGLGQHKSQLRSRPSTKSCTRRLHLPKTEGAACAVIGTPSAPYGTLRVLPGSLHRDSEDGCPCRALWREPRPCTTSDPAASANQLEGEQRRDRAHTRGPEAVESGSRPVTQVRARQKEAALVASPAAGPHLINIAGADRGIASAGLLAPVPRAHGTPPPPRQACAIPNGKHAARICHQTDITPNGEPSLQQPLGISAHSIHRPG
ncbi:hypothetical protein NDU88_002670 [Pleurodeles waltl]|uniref:Uncharacterized protein n=1 Tax=Pleurodeles waltl TaxID=8319 RepID=A0AAV7UWA9_PLEWA|nr:hypothetical protein NDU88_002670 [Pleurodeles waltl]